MSILITGSAGFIGFHTAKHFLSQGFNVVGVDNFNNYYSNELKQVRQEILKKSENFTPVEADISNREIVENLFKQHEFRTVIHLAAQPGVRVPFEDSERYSRANLLGFGNVLQSAQYFQVPYFLYASSSSVYGKTSHTPFDENLSTPQPINFYGGTKLANEILVSSTISQTNMKAVGLRFFTVYGPFGRPDMAYMKILSRNLFDTKFELFGDGSALRDFTYIDDVVKSIALLHQKMSDWELGTAEVVNIGGGHPRKMNDLIQIMNRITEYKFDTVASREDPLDMKLTIANTAHLQDLIDFKPTVSLEDGIEKLITWAVQPDIKEKLLRWLK